MSTITRPMTATITVEEYERMIEEGEIGEHDDVELIKGRIVVKMGQGPIHASGSEKSRRPIERLVPPGWLVRIEKPVRIPAEDSEPVPDLSIVRGDVEDYLNRHPQPEDVALIVEVAKTSLALDREQAVILGAAGIPVYWIVNIDDRQLEVYPGAPGVAGAHPPPTILDESATVELVIDRQVVGQIAVADLLPRRP
jgi:Uma2 family endonuclease